MRTLLIMLLVLPLAATSAPAADTRPASADTADKVDGVLQTISGYTGGHVKDPSYQQVSAGGTGHAEAVKIVYDPSKVSYRELVEYFWRHVDPTQANGQFCDHGPQYRTAIFVHDEEQRRVAERSKAELERTKPFPGDIVTEIVDAGPFYPAEEYHQNYYEKSSLKYKYYRWRCGRDQRIEELWGDH